MMEAPSPTNEEMERLIRTLPLEIDKLHNEFNKYFSGAEKKAPIPQRDQVQKAIDRLKALLRQSQSPQLSFRAQGVVSKFATYRTLWDKRLLEREQAKKR